MCDCRVIICRKRSKELADPNEKRVESERCAACPSGTKSGERHCSNPNPCAQCRTKT
ncbi:hypothetical protein HGA34_05185 [Candidatus Falkowbacteria bacterium]|nr:hypothetical protein [Candidatus Falkowbacteria bacterium]